MTDIHIGRLIQQKMKELHISNTTLAKKLYCTRQNISSIIKRKTLSTDMLREVSEAMDYNFFRHYTLEKQADLEKKTEELQATITELEKQLDYAMRDIARCERIIGLLGGKK